MRHELAHSRHEHVFIVRAVEYPYLAARRYGSLNAPQEVVRGLEVRGHLEARHIAALRIEHTHHVTNDAVLARGVHALQDDEQRTFGLAVEAILQLVDLCHALGRAFDCGFPVRATLGGSRVPLG